MEKWLFDLSLVQAAKPTVLVVDDDVQMRQLLQRRLAQSSKFSRILQAEDAAEAIFIARRENPDIVLMDFNLPWMNGRIAARYLRKETETKVVVVSGVIDEDEADWADAFVSKTELDSLIEVLLPLVRPPGVLRPS